MRRSIEAGAVAMATWFVTTGAAQAASGREDASGLFVWAFLGLCALIVAAQVIPAVLMMIGAARGVAEGLRERRTAGAGSEAKGS